jgi:glycosyltransferase involved in cell wall biosynthesis
MKLAWFSPFPPVRTGIAACSADLVAALRARGYDIDPYPTEAAHDFPWKHRQRPYDLIVYQFGNSSHHDYAWAYALRYPGLVVLHDTHLHHARAAFLLRERRAADYRAEFGWNHPDAPLAAAELAIAGLDSRLFYEWPMIRGLVDASRLVAVHGEGARRLLAESTPNATTPNSQSDLAERIVSIRLGHGQLVGSDERLSARKRVRAKLGIADEAVLFGLFGGLTPEKRIPQVLAAMRALVPHAPSARLLLAGAPAAHYPVHADIAAHGLQDRVTVTGYLDSDAELTDHLAACDVSLNLRWPTARETSGAWLRALAAGVPSIITDLAHLGGVPSLDPRTWMANEAAGARREAQPPSQGDGQTPKPDSRLESRASPPVCVAIDIVDEDHSLRLAMRRLAQDAELRTQLGRAGQTWWEREHSVEAMVEDYERVMLQVLKVPGVLEEHVPMGLGVPTMPEHLRPDGDAKLRALLRPFGIEHPL